MAIFTALDEEMVHLFEEGTPEGLEKCDKIAKTLLSYAELPLGLRCRACIVLAAWDEPGYVEWAKEAVRVADLGKWQFLRNQGVGPANNERLAWAQTTEHSDAEHRLRQRAYECLEQAKKQFEEDGGYAKGEEQDDQKEEGNDDEEDDEEQYETVRLISSSTASVGPDGKVTVVVHKAPSPDATSPVERLGKGKYRVRVDMGTRTVQVQDLETGEWDTVDDVEFIE